MKLVCLACSILLLLTAIGYASTKSWIWNLHPESSLDDETVGVKGRARELPLKPAREISFSIEEGTWISLDVSPDGETIVFDLLGDLYLLPIGGGEAEVLTSGLEFDHQPRFSPDGQEVVYVSDRDGSNNVWVVNLADKVQRQISEDYWMQFVSPEWGAEGNSIYATRYQFGNSVNARVSGLRGNFNGEILKFPASGNDAPEVIFNGSQIDAGALYSGASIARDNQRFFVTTSSSPRSIFSRQRIHQIDAENETSFPVSVKGINAYRPRISPNGRHLAFLSEEHGHIRMMLQDLSSGAIKILVDDVGNSRAGRSNDNTDLHPGYAFAPDGQSIIYSGEGLIWRVDINSGNRKEVPFRAQVDIELGPLVHRSNSLPEVVFGRDVRNAELSPDGSKAAFSTFGKVWIFDLSTGLSTRVSEDDHIEDLPTWSPDGNSLIYSTWSPNVGGHIYSVPSDLNSSPRPLTVEPAYFQKTAFSPDGSHIAVIRGSIEDGRRPSTATSLELGLIPLRSGKFTPIDRFTDSRVNGASLVFSDDGCVLSIVWLESYFRRYSEETSDDNKGAASSAGDECDNDTPLVNLVRVESQSPVGGVIYDFVSSPTGEHALVLGRDGLHLVTFDSPITNYGVINLEQLIADGEVSLHKVSETLEKSPNWSVDGDWFHYTKGRRLYSHNLNDAKNAWAKKREYFPYESDVIVEMDQELKNETIVLRGARLITVRGDDVIERGDVIVRGNKIVGIGPQGSIEFPDTAVVMDVSEKTIIPGLIDLHAHTWTNLFANDRVNLIEEYSSPHLGYLSFGVTTIRDPGSSDLAYTDLSEAGLLVGPRTLSAPNIDSRLQSSEDFERRIDEISRFDGDQTIKFRFSGPREVDQWAIIASQNANVFGTRHIHSSIEGLTVIMDGYAGIEHYFGGDVYFDDVIQVISKSGTTYTPTLSNSMSGEREYFFQAFDPFGDVRVSRFFSPRYVNQRKRSIQRANVEERRTKHIRAMAKSLSDVIDAGGLVGVGGHGDFWGVDTHVELQIYQSGGIPPIEILRSATQVGADALGLGNELGSLEVGKLADLVVLDRNPLEDIRHTKSVQFVMRNGELFEANTLNQVWPVKKSLPGLWWWTEVSPQNPN